ncbi:hypothetical protein JI742_00490 [Piscinibacter sp. Jin2]|uniref:Uncharacterized protein n=1 Tax=Aquariibacter lacus TaxID=2801332 RepID=A0A9X0XBJ7_9BURK|nr:hypothetical protein [Piscinibacter lacus]MBL0718356.1 hypothetical protein [Piscinibacter lacus]
MDDFLHITHFDAPTCTLLIASKIKHQNESPARSYRDKHTEHTEPPKYVQSGQPYLYYPTYRCTPPISLSDLMNMQQLYDYRPIYRNHSSAGTIIMLRRKVSKINIASFVLMLLLSCAAHSQQAWLEVAKNDDGIWEVQNGSFEETKTKGGEAIAIVVSRVTNRSTNRIDLRKSYVTLSACERRMGKIVTLDLDGKFRFENDFVVGGETIASAVAEFICEVYSIRAKEAEKKWV